MNKATLRFFALVALMALGVFWKINYSDGDDAIFDDMVHSMPYFEYIKTRYLTWTGRIGAESLVYLLFSIGIWFWRFTNAIMVAALPMLILLIIKQLRPVGTAAEKESLWQALRLPLMICAGYLLMDIITCGHAAVWVNGSVFYTWSFVLALLCIFLHLKFLNSGTFSGKHAALMFPILFFAAASIEQIGFLLLAFLASLIAYRKFHQQPIPTSIFAEVTFLMIILAIVLMAPGNSARISEEIQRWFPSFGELSLHERAFISAQWFLSSLANEGKLFLVFIWIGSLLASQKKNKVEITCTIIFSAVALLPFAKIDALSDTGINYIDPAIPPTVFPSFANATSLNILAMTWWVAALLFSFSMIKKALSLKGIALFTIALLCEAMMFFTPTIYASGERVFFVTDWIWLLMIAMLFLRIPTERLKNAFCVSVFAFALVNFLRQIPEILSKLNG